MPYVTNSHNGTQFCQNIQAFRDFISRLENRKFTQKHLAELFFVSPRTVTRAGVPYLKLHALRHTAATMLVDAGLKPHQLQQMLHTSMATTLKYYVGVNRQMMTDAARLIGKSQYSTTIQRKNRK